MQHDRTKKGLTWLAWVFLGSSVLIALVLVGAQVRLDNFDRTVDIVVDGLAAESYALQTGQRYTTVLAHLRGAGATAVAVAERNLASMQVEGKLSFMTGAEIRRLAALTPPAPGVRLLMEQGAIGDGYTYVWTNLPEIAELLDSRLGADYSRWIAPGLLEIRLGADRVRQFTLGFDPQAFALVRSQGLRSVPRPGYYPVGTRDRLGESFAELSRIAATAGSVIFQGSEVPGFPAALGATSGALQASGWLVGLIEQPGKPGYIVQKGQEFLAQDLNYHVTRVSTTMDGILERGARILYVRPSLGDDPVELVHGTVHQLLDAGFQIGLPTGFQYVRVTRALQGLMSLALVGAGMLLLTYAGRVSPRTQIIMAGLAVPCALLWPFLAPGLVGSVQVDLRVVLPAAALAWLLRRAPTQLEGVLTLVCFVLAGTGGRILSGAVGLIPSLLLGLRPGGDPTQTLTFGLIFAGFVFLWTSRSTFNPQMELRAEQGLIGVALVMLAVTLYAAPDWGPALLGASPLAGQYGPGRTVGLIAGLMGALALAVSPLTTLLPALVGVAVGLLIGAMVVNSEGSPRHG